MTNARDPKANPVAAFIVPTLPHPYLIPDANPGYRRLREAYDSVRREIEAIDPDLLLIYSTHWPSVIGHQVQAREEPEWVHVDQEWHELGSIPYKFRMDKAFGEKYVEMGRGRGLEMRTVDYHGFPIDTATVVALKLLDPRNRYRASVVSCNMYADRGETIVLGKAARDAIKTTARRTVAIACTALSNRMWHDIVPFHEDRIHSLKDDEWNRKYLEFLARGRLEDASQLARQFTVQAHGDSKMKAIWWLAAVMGQTNNFEGTLFAYEGLYGTGAAVVGLVPTIKPAADLEFDEDDQEVYGGDRNVLATGSRATRFEEDQPGAEFLRQRFEDMERARMAEAEEEKRPVVLEKRLEAGVPDARVKMVRPEYEEARKRSPIAANAPRRNGRDGPIIAKSAPKPVGAYVHARRVGELLFLSGLGPRDPKTDQIPGGPVRDAAGNKLDYDVAAQTEAVIENTRRVLDESGATLDDIVDVQVFLINMDRDFKAFNEVYRKHFEHIQATRTTVAIDALPTPIAVEFKVVAHVPTDRQVGPTGD
jgi:reactive intermediate/imine deaminase